MPRHDVRMTPAEVDAFVQDEEAGVLAHLDEHGDPTAILVGSRGLGTGVALTAATARPLPPDGTQVCVAYEREPSYSGVRAALVLGRLAGDHVVVDRTISFDFGKIPAPVREDDN
ncbi:hypothetical protein ACFQ34_19000 [Pseudonocardia benzenivorans]|uniref:Uncharacterized protein n=2 Tax=Pseudonocardia TaxID=1847 RepID=F4CVU0_PSEUX|nr:hypothetical protein [Pseudonocardia dioxanivorans]AEA25425.1 hypothetical protein Psed_3231 [Pseudonocardia dioxanivorans CB1190]GJF02394.1 hypothetical protein PSD17_13570 [Pseudonocardia sp. D17]